MATYNGIELSDKARPMICEVCTKSEGEYKDGKYIRNEGHMCKEGHKPFVARQWLQDGTFEPDPTGKHFLCKKFHYGNWG